MSKLQQIKKRIKASKGSQQITITMERIASLRIQKAQMRIESSRPYAVGLESLTRRLTRGITASVERFPLLDVRPRPERAAVVIIASDRGLCGSFNSDILNFALRRIKRLEAQGIEVDIYCIGRRSAHYFEFIGRPVVRSFSGVTDEPKLEQAVEIADMLMEIFVSGRVDRVEIAYNYFKSLVAQSPERLDLLPIKAAEPSGSEAGGAADSEMLIEPAPAAILEELLPRYVRTTVYRLLLESSASEHAARRRAMKMASDNAADLIKRLNKKYNQARQASITESILEIISTKDAIEQSAM